MYESHKFSDLRNYVSRNNFADRYKENSHHSTNDEELHKISVQHFFMVCENFARLQQF